MGKTGVWSGKLEVQIDAGVGRILALSHKVKYSINSSIVPEKSRIHLKR